MFDKPLTSKEKKFLKEQDEMARGRQPVAGLTKREYFAGLAMQGLASSSEGDYHDGVVAKNAVRMADLLLKALAK